MGLGVGKVKVMFSLIILHSGGLPLLLEEEMVILNNDNSRSAPLHILIELNLNNVLDIFTPNVEVVALSLLIACKLFIVSSIMFVIVAVSAIDLTHLSLFSTGSLEENSAQGKYSFCGEPTIKHVGSKFRHCLSLLTSYSMCSNNINIQLVSAKEVNQDNFISLFNS